MPGIYIHIPFCKQACHYCNFHFSTSLKHKGEMVAAILQELELRKDYLSNKNITSIYFGGGTPSLLNNNELDQILDKIYHVFKIEHDAEITLEANPDDLTKEKLQALRQTPINRLSIGIQSFAEEDLKFMNRAHNATEAKRCIENALEAGFENLTVDLIYGSPTTSDAQWETNIQTIINYNIPHISCYALTVEPKTALDHFVKVGKAPSIDEEQAARQFEILIQLLTNQGYEHYEISNFAKPGWYAKHNSSYWFGEPYLGIGPAAHSFDGNNIRQWNVANNALYIKNMLHFEGEAYLGIQDLAHLEGTPNPLFEKEILTPAQRYNEYIMTSLRTMWGIKLPDIQAFGKDFEAHFLQTVPSFIEKGWIFEKDNSFILSTKGKLFADFISAELFKDVEELRG
ncbi:MAG: radical SAM family heme chaperone HemW [Saprospiraceae bacterium]|nr:radical SAM family heme chaperone HemW [Saprospiraceae bacterium]